MSYGKWVELTYRLYSNKWNRKFTKEMFTTPIPKDGDVWTYDNKTGKAMKEYATRTAPKDAPAKTTTATPSTKPAATGSVKNAPTRSNPKTYGEGNEKVRGGPGGDKAGRCRP